MTVRSSRILVLASVLLAGCTAGDGTFTPGPTPSPESMATVRGSEPASASEEPSVTASRSVVEFPIATSQPGYLGPWVGAQTLVDRLAVRKGPGATYPMISAYRDDFVTGTSVLAEPAVRLPAGYYVFIDQGPLVIDGIGWYLVWNRPQPGELSENHLSWDSGGDKLPNEGWIAGGLGTTPYLKVGDPPPGPGDFFAALVTPYPLMHATGNGRSDVFTVPVNAGLAVHWVAGDPEGLACDLKVTIKPLGDVILTQHVADAWDAGWGPWPTLQQSGETGPAPAGDYWLEVESDCTWSLQAQPLQ